MLRRVAGRMVIGLVGYFLGGRFGVEWGVEMMEREEILGTGGRHEVPYREQISRGSVVENTNSPGRGISQQP
jgi:hypothetical protein